MCLSLITALPKSTAKHRVGYKVCKITAEVVPNLKTMSNIYNYTGAVEDITLGKWYKANRTRVCVDRLNEGLDNYYESGFHLYESLEAAKRDCLQWPEHSHWSIKHVIVKCTCKYMRVVGTQRMTLYNYGRKHMSEYDDTVMVADWIRYDEVLDATV